MEELIQAVRRLSRASVLVVGDAMLDRTVFGTVDRVSPEAPAPVLCVDRELAAPGGAGNVVRNLGALGAAVAFVSVVGDDQAGSDLTGLIGGQQGVEPWLLVQGGRATTLKTRFVAQNRHGGGGAQLLRADLEDTTPIHPKLGDRLVRIALDAMAATSVTVLSDYGKGVLSHDIPARLIAAAKQASRRLIADLHGNGFAACAGADILLAQSRELRRALGRPVGTDAELHEAAAALRAAHSFGVVLVNRADGGMSLIDAEGPLAFPPPREVLDVSGAGDSAVAVLAAALAIGLAPRAAARLAALAAGITLGRPGTAVVREADLLAAIRPEAGALDKIMPRALASDRVERWRREGLRTGFARVGFEPLDTAAADRLVEARAACDRLVVGVPADAGLPTGTTDIEPEALRAARLASLACVDLVVVHESAAIGELLRALRPDLLAEAAGADPSEWGGRLLLGA